MRDQIRITYGPSQEDYSVPLDVEEFEGCETREEIDERLQELVDDDANRNLACHADPSELDRVCDWLESARAEGEIERLRAENAQLERAIAAHKRDEAERVETERALD